MKSILLQENVWKPSYLVHLYEIFWYRQINRNQLMKDRKQEIFYHLPKMLNDIEIRVTSYHIQRLSWRPNRLFNPSCLSRARKDRICNLIIAEPASGLAPNGARVPANKSLPMEWNVFSSQFLRPLMIMSNVMWIDAFIQNRWGYIAKYRRFRRVKCTCFTCLVRVDWRLCYKRMYSWREPHGFSNMAFIMQDFAPFVEQVRSTMPLLQYF